LLTCSYWLRHIAGTEVAPYEHFFYLLQ